MPFGDGKTQFHSSMIVDAKANHEAAGLARITAACGLVLLLAATLFPYHFLSPEQIRFSNPLTGLRSIQARGNSLLIGVDGAFGQPFKGKIDEVRIYKRTLSKSEIERDVNTSLGASPTLLPSDGLVAAYSFDEGSGNSITDSTQNGNKGILINGPMRTIGRLGGGLGFNGVNQYVEIPSSPSIDISGTNITLSLWVNIAKSGNDDRGDQAILAKPWLSNSMADPFYQYAVEFAARSQTLNFYFGDTSGTLRGPFECAIPLGEWNHLAFTYDGANVRGYVNGSEQLSTPVAGPLRFSDILLNILLYMPLGFGLAAMAHQRRAKQAIAVMKIAVIGFGLSAIIEVLQNALPTRVPSAIDVMSNSLGTVLGSLAAFFGGWKIFEKVGHRLQRCSLVVSTTKLATTCLVYAAFVFLLSAKLQQAATLASWDEASTLILGNDHTGTRPWEGQITHLEFANKAINESLAKQSLGEGLSRLVDGWVASYALAAEGPYRELTGRLPALSWRGKLPHRPAAKGVATTRTAWLESEALANRLVQEIQKTNQFTLSIGCTPASPTPRQPGRILSLSKDHNDVDLEIDQDGASLVVDLRAPMTGMSGRQPQLVVSNVFPNASRHNLLVTFDGSRIQVYVDGLLRPDSLDLSPGSALAAKLFPTRAEETKGFGLIYYGFVFLPLGCLLGVFSRRLSSRLLFAAVLVVSIASLASAVLEITLMGIRGGSFDTGNLLVGIFLAIGSGWASHHLLNGAFSHGHLAKLRRLNKLQVEVK